MDRRPISRDLSAALLIGGVAVLAPPHAVIADTTLSFSEQRPAMDMVPPKDLEVFIRNEFDFLAAKGTREDLELFIRRYPDHPLAIEAQKRLDTMPPAARH